MQNFKMSASEYVKCAPKYTISRLNNQNFSGEGHSPLPRPLPGTLPLGTVGARPPTQKSWLRPWVWLTIVPWTRGRCLVWDFTRSDTLATSHLSTAVVGPGTANSDVRDSKKSKHSM